MSTQDGQIIDIEEEKVYQVENVLSTKAEMFRLNVQVPEACYVKPINSKAKGMYIKLIIIAFAAIFAETLALVIISSGVLKVWWSLLLVAIVFYAVLNLIISPIGKKKRYEEIVSAGEDFYSYTFFSDYMHISNAGEEVDLRYEVAEYYAENDDVLVLAFPAKKNIFIEKKACTKEQLEFLRNVIPEENQAENEKKTHSRYILILLLMLVYSGMLAICTVINMRISNTIKSYEYATEYQYTDYIEFSDFVGEGAVKDVVIYDERYIEYTHMEIGGDVRYYTIYDGDLDVLTTVLGLYGVNWKLGGYN